MERVKSLKQKKDYNFGTDLVVGERGEAVILEHMEGYGYKLANDNKDNKYDLKLIEPNGDKVLFEVKTDVFCHPEMQLTDKNGVDFILEEQDRGNLFVEKECRGKESGIIVTKSKWFVTYLPFLNEAWFIRSEVLKELLDSEYFYVTIGSGDENSNTKGYLMDRDKYKHYFKVQPINHKWDANG